jgi:RimJ/RimL family protein N-acetyltransferase
VARKDGTVAEFGIQLKSGGELLGLVGPDNVDAAHAPAELSFLLHERFWGQGYATDPYFSFQLSAFQLLSP